MLENEVFNRSYVRDITKTCECDCSITYSHNKTELDRSKEERKEAMIKLKRCPHCGSEVVLCKINGYAYAAYEFSIVCTGCGLETRIVMNPQAQCIFDMGEAVKRIAEKWNRRDEPHEDFAENRGRDPG